MTSYHLMIFALTTLLVAITITVYIVLRSKRHSATRSTAGDSEGPRMTSTEPPLPEAGELGLLEPGLSSLEFGNLSLLEERFTALDEMALTPNKAPADESEAENDRDFLAEVAHRSLGNNPTMIPWYGNSKYASHAPMAPPTSRPFSSPSP